MALEKNTDKPRIQQTMNVWGNELAMVLLSLILLAGSYVVISRILGDAPITASAISEPFWTMGRITIYNAFSWLMTFLYNLRASKTGDQSAEPWFMWAIFMVCCSLLGF